MGLFFNRKKKKKSNQKSTYELILKEKDSLPPYLDPDLSEYHKSPAEEKATNNYWEATSKMKGFKRTNPTVNQIDNYIKYAYNSLDGFETTLSYWKRLNWEHNNIPARDEAIEIIMRVFGFYPAHILNEYFNSLGLGEYKSLETYKDMKQKISRYNSVAEEVISYISLEGLVSLKQLKKDLKHLDPEALKWVLNRAYFIKKTDVDKDKLIEIDEDYIFTNFHGINTLLEKK